MRQSIKLMLLSLPSKYTTTVPTYILFVTSFSTDRSLARRTVVAVVAGALEGLVEAAPELAVGPLLADGAVGPTPAGITAAGV